MSRCKSVMRWAVGCVVCVQIYVCFRLRETLPRRENIKSPREAAPQTTGVSCAIVAPEQSPIHRIGILVTADPEYLKRGARVGSGSSITLAISSMQCWASTHGYYFFLESHDLTSHVPWGTQGVAPFVSKLLAAEKYLRRVDWLLVLDADCVVANRTKRIEDILDDRFHLTFHERLHNREVDAAAWLVKNSHYSFQFIREWIRLTACQCMGGDTHFHNNDNGALLLLLMHRIFAGRPREELCFNLFDQSKTVYDYLQFVQCVHDKLSGGDFPPTSEHIQITTAENSWFRHLESRWHLTGEWGVVDGTSMWNRWLGNEFLVHTKDPDTLLSPLDALCQDPPTGFIRPDLMMDPPAALVSVSAESSRFGHREIAHCFPSCPPLVALSGGETTIQPPPMYCERGAGGCYQSFLSIFERKT